jgi:hypothetical protein
MSQQHLQRLFEKISDSYEHIVEQKNLTDECMDLQFQRHGVEVARVRLSVVSRFHRGAIDKEFGFEDEELVRVVDHYGGEEVLVSPVISAVIAVCTR